jgi:hypothetical protein
MMTVVLRKGGHIRCSQCHGEAQTQTRKISFKQIVVSVVKEERGFGGLRQGTMVWPGAETASPERRFRWRLEGGEKVGAGSRRREWVLGRGTSLHLRQADRSRGLRL